MLQLGVLDVVKRRRWVIWRIGRKEDEKGGCGLNNSTSLNVQMCWHVVVLYMQRVLNGVVHIASKWFFRHIVSASFQILASGIGSDNNVTVWTGKYLASMDYPFTNIPL